MTKENKNRPDGMIDPHEDIVHEEEEGDSIRFPKKPPLNAARLFSFGAYRPLYDIKPVDEEKKLWKGRPVIEPSMKKMPGAQQIESSWVYFTRDYDDRNDWDRLYHEHEFEDENIIGQKFILIPKEKLLFAYEPPPSNILLVDPGVFGRN